MARCPFAVWRPMPYGSYLMPNPVRANLHTAVSSASSLYSYFATRSGKVHSHFYVAKDGTIEQYRDTAYAAAAAAGRMLRKTSPISCPVCHPARGRSRRSDRRSGRR